MQSSHSFSPSITPAPSSALSEQSSGCTPFEAEWVSIQKSHLIQLKADCNSYKSLHQKSQEKITRLEAELELANAKIKDLQQRLFGKKTEKSATSPSEATPATGSKRPRGQQKGSKGHGRTTNADHIEIEDEILSVDLNAHCCSQCGKPPQLTGETGDFYEFKEVEVRAYTRRVYPPILQSTCQCTPQPVLISPAIPQLIPRSPYGLSFWTEVLVSKFHYARPTHRLLMDLKDQGMPVSAGSVAGGLQILAPLFDPIIEAFYSRQMQETVFHCDETRWPVFVPIAGKVGSRWYLWVTRSASVVYFDIDPGRSAAVPGAHFAGLQINRVAGKMIAKAIIVCDRYSAYKKLMRLCNDIYLAFCWAHVRRDFLDAGRSFESLEDWALEWKARIGSVDA